MAHTPGTSKSSSSQHLCCKWVIHLSTACSRTDYSLAFVSRAVLVRYFDVDDQGASLPGSPSKLRTIEVCQIFDLALARH